MNLVSNLAFTVRKWKLINIYYVFKGTWAATKYIPDIYDHYNTFNLFFILKENLIRRTYTTKTNTTL